MFRVNNFDKLLGKTTNSTSNTFLDHQSESCYQFDNPFLDFSNLHYFLFCFKALFREKSAPFRFIFLNALFFRFELYRSYVTSLC